MCGTPTAKVHGYQGRTVRDVPVTARPSGRRPRVATTSGKRRPDDGGGRSSARQCLMARHHQSRKGACIPAAAVRGCPW
ncbi:hypothetical protein [Streptomyces sp. NA02950]|uniref:hypothetical protein n=1 Tax=Streptomyces sp. NA02950 TaxID=2742137 RepID=UPI0026E06F55|nr:hypothetical protein [Streptomyces sp. NA02950]